MKEDWFLQILFLVEAKFGINPKGFFFIILGRKCPTLPKMNSSRDVSKQYNKNLSDSNVILSRNHLVRKRTRPIWLNG